MPTSPRFPFAVLAMTTALAAQSPKVPAAPYLQPDEKATAAAPDRAGAPRERQDQAPRQNVSQAAKLPPNATARFAAALRGPATDMVLRDVDSDGRVVAATRRYKATFGKGAWTFFGRPSAGAAGYAPIGFRLDQCTIDDLAQPLGAQQALVAHQSEDLPLQVTIDHGACVEVLDLIPDSLEQSFVFTTLPNRGELCLRLAIDTALRGEDLGHGIRFHGEYNEVHYGEAMARDAAGRVCAAATQLVDGAITMRVPAWFVVDAALPLVVDPLVTETAIVVDGDYFGVPDAAWDESLGCWAVCYAHDYLPFDHDCYLQRFDDSLTPIGGPLTIDVSTASWEDPRIADNNLGNTFLTVAQVSANGLAPHWIEGRIYAGGFSLQAPFTIERDGTAGHASGEKLAPDVGGDPALVGPTYFTVVWERVWSNTDHDVHMKQVLPNGVLRSATPTLVDNSLADDRAPRISNSNGPLASSAQRHGVTWQRTVTVGDHDVYGSLWSWDGQPVLVGGAISFPVATGRADQGHPTVSTPNGVGAAPRQLLFAWEEPNTNNGDLGLAMFDALGQSMATANLSALLVGVPLGYPHRRPVVDGDGARFGVAYLEGYLGTNDWDSYVTFVAPVGGQLVVQADPLGLTWSQYLTDSPNLASRYASTGVHSTAYLTVDSELQPQRSIVSIHRVDGHHAGWQLRPRSAGCGNLSAYANGSSVIGTSFTLSLSATSGFVGFLAGDYVPATPLSVCPNCTVVVSNATTVPGPVLHVDVPLDPSFVGLAMTFQGFAVSGTGSCLGAVELSNGFEVTFR